ncbi:MAG: hypothetical protein ABJ239_05645 [Erythrobacter sp.]
MSISIALFMMLQVGPSGQAGPVGDPHDMVRDRPPRQAAEVVGEVAAAPLPQSVWLNECFELVDTDPARANSLAQIKRDSTSGTERVLANHCLGLAATKMELWDQAQAAFIAARNEVPAEELPLRARMGAMAGNAALARKDSATALTLFDASRADALASNSGDLAALVALDQARVLVGLDRLEEAGPLLVEALNLRPNDPETRLLSATFFRRQGQLSAAQMQIEQALKLAPTDPEIGLEAGVIAVLDGRDNTARSSWELVVATNPDHPAATTARDYLDQLGPAGQ